jgi:hypothetical protein
MWVCRLPYMSQSLPVLVRRKRRRARGIRGERVPKVGVRRGRERPSEALVQHVAQQCVRPVCIPGDGS